MKLSIIALFGILPVISAVDSSCVGKIDTAQKCLNDCVDAPSYELSANGVMYGNVLTECLDQDFETNWASNLENCCNAGIDVNCTGSLTAADECLSSELSLVQEAGAAYLTCIADRYADQSCIFANFCVGILTGGYNSTYSNDFGAQEVAFNLAGATTCADPSVMAFGSTVCGELTNCCQPCDEALAGLANAVAAAFFGTGEVCDTTCAAYMGRRNLAEMVGPTTIDVQNTELATTLASECVDALATDIVLYNETYAVSNHFDCVTKKMGKIAAEMDNRAQESSSISLSFGRITALSMIASVVYSAIA